MQDPENQIPFTFVKQLKHRRTMKEKKEEVYMYIVCRYMKKNESSH